MSAPPSPYLTGRGWLCPVAVALAVATLIVAPACSDNGGGEALVELGTGTINFEPLTADQDLLLIAGPQGGHHFIVHARAQGISPGNPNLPGQIENPATWFEAYSEDGDQLDLIFPPYRLGYVEGEGDWYELPSGRILQVNELFVAALYGQRARLVVRLQDANGATGTAEAWVRAVEDPNPPDGDGGLPPFDAGPGDAGSSDSSGLDAGVPDAAMN